LEEVISKIYRRGEVTLPNGRGNPAPTLFFFGEIWYAFRKLIIMVLKRILIASFALLLIPFFVSAFTGPSNSACPSSDQGLVPCGGKDCPCTICHFFELINRILVLFLVKIIPP
jgi:hypothetical protein